MTVGVDGCREGWIAVFHGRDELDYRLYADIQTLMDAHAAAALVLMDVPIGLPWPECARRPCDVEARRVLGARRAPSVFSPPCRAASRACDIETARAHNVRELGRSLSAQAWGICPKVAEVDAWLQAHPTDHRRLLEVHPEVCFWSLNGRRPMRYRKSTREGLAERLSLLCRLEPGTEGLLNRVLREKRRKDVGADDVLDATVALVTGSLSRGAMRALEGVPASDDTGLPMRMIYRDTLGL